ncbi:MAG: CbbQ/NirQ/NorQ/GpvN family protein, partial [Desulfobacteraceae bacterium]|nr:CbbQ/NirQ/NorQ/GpvN family protein [Desulfobacteraceae bacterium]
PGENVGFNGIIQGEPLVIPENGGEIVYPHPDFRFVATGNTIGDGDDGLYLGASRQNIAFLDRFWAVLVDYIDAKAEKKILKDQTGLDDEIIKNLVKLGNETRKMYVKEELDTPLSTRVLIRVGKMMKIFYAVAGNDLSPLHYALDRARLFLASPESREAIHEIAQRIFGE